MSTEMLVISKADLSELTEQIKTLNKNFANITGLNKEEQFLTREQVREQYKLSAREVAKIFNNLLKEKVVNIGKLQKLAKRHIDELFIQGITLK